MADTVDVFERSGTRLAFRDSAPEGDAPVLLCLHAFPVDSRMYAHQIDLDARVIALDAAGFGASGPAPRVLDVDRVADDAAALLDHLGVERAVVVGTSMGGYQAMAYARNHADRLAGLVLINTRAQADSDEQRAGRTQTISLVESKGTSALADAMLHMLLGAESVENRPELVAELRTWITEQPPAATIAALRGLASRPDASHGLGNVDVPAAVLHGDQDKIGTTATAEEIASLIPDASLHIIAKAGHLPPVENPAATNAAIAELLDRL